MHSLNYSCFLCLKLQFKCISRCQFETIFRLVFCYYEQTICMSELTKTKKKTFFVHVVFMRLSMTLSVFLPIRSIDFRCLYSVKVTKVLFVQFFRIIPKVLTQIKLEKQNTVTRIFISVCISEHSILKFDTLRASHTTQVNRICILMWKS